MKIKNIIAATLACFMLITMMPIGFAAQNTVSGAVPEDTLYELENASHSGMSTKKLDSSYASGGTYITNSGKYITDKKDIIKDDLSFVMNVAQGGSVRMFVRLLFPNLNAGSFFYRYDDGEWQLIKGGADRNYQWIEIPGQYLTGGIHKFSICRQSEGILFDAAYFTRNVDFVPSVPEGVELIPETERKIAHEQDGIPEITSTGIILEAEELTYEEGMVMSDELKASGKAAIKVLMPEQASPMTAPHPTTPGTMEYEFTAAEDCGFSVWFRVYAVGPSSDSGYVAIDGITNYVDHAFPYHNVWYWKQVITRFEAKKGQTYKFKFHFREKQLLIDQIIITGMVGYEPAGSFGNESTANKTDSPIVTELKEKEMEALEPLWGTPPYSPPAGEHPRVLFRESDREEIIAKLNHPDNKYYKSVFDSYVAEKDVDIGSSYSSPVLYKLQSKALYYALYGDKEVGRDAIDLALRTMKVWPFLTDLFGHTRINGMLIYTWSEVYDWCYDLLTEEEKTTFINRCIQSAAVMECGWPPNKQDSLYGHGAEAQVLRDIMSFAIATYDERPDIWNQVGGRFYQEFVPERIYFHKAHIHTQGGNYGIYRNSWDLYAYRLITAMGLPEPYPAEDVAAMDMAYVIYLRRPDGVITLDGDMYWADPMLYNHTSETATIFGASIGQNPYLKDEHVRASYKADKNGISVSLGASDEILFAEQIILSEPEMERKSIANLPLSEYFGSPMGVMAARTGWSDGVQSDDVVAQMKIGEVYTLGHQMPAAGHFAIYYKGPLTNQGGVYDIFNSPAFNHYNKTTVASNCMLVYDPNEPKSNFMWSDNNGGQMVNSPAEIPANAWNEPWQVRDENIRGKIEGHEIDPTDPMAPDYTYLKGDITKWYSDKVTDYHRSMMFLNLKEDKIPAAMVVFDKLSVKNPTFKKTWLLHGQTDPVIAGGRTVWGTSPFVNSLGERYTGKMVHDIILPEPSKLSKTVVGGPEEGWNIVNGVNVPGNTNNSESAEENTYRLELSPTDNNQTELFLNVIQVTDGSNNSYHNVSKVESNDFAGISISDRVVLFSKNAKRFASDFDVTVVGSGSRKYTICDVESGVWSVTNGAKTFEVIVTEEGGVLAFDGTAGSVSAKFVTKEIPEVEEVPVIHGDKKIYYVKVNNNLAYLPVDPVFENGKLMVPIKYIAPKMNLVYENEFMKEVYSDALQKINVEIRPNTDYMLVNGKKVSFQNPTYTKDGYLIVELRTFAEAFNYIVHWDDTTQTVYLVSNPKIVKETLEDYAEVINVTGNEGVSDTTILSSSNVADGSLETAWAANAEFNPVGFVLELKEETLLENIEIVFNPNNFRTPYFEVYSSQDGENFELIYKGEGSSSANGFDFETFKFDPQKEVKAKFIKYLALGSNISKWNGVKEMRFKKAEPIISWEDKEEYAKVAMVLGDDGEISPENLASNVADNNSRTIWAAQGIGRFITFDLGEAQTLKGVNIMFNPSAKRIPKFEIQVSDDGTKFTSVYSSIGNPNSERFTWENFEFAESVTAKYVRYVGLGSNISAWNGVNEIRFIKE